MDKLQIQKIRNTTEEVKDVIYTISYCSGVSVPKAQIAVQAVCEQLYKHKCFLEPPLSPALQKRASQWSFTANLQPLNAHFYHVMIIVTDGFSKRFFY